MFIDLLKLNYSPSIDIDEEVIIPKEYYEKMDIVSLSKIKVIGNITLDSENNYVIDLDISGEMMLHDAITYDVIPYNFKTNIEETLENLPKRLDLIEFLWHYIVLEVPLRFTNTEIKEVENENYRIISEEEYNKKNNPFKDFFSEREE